METMSSLKLSADEWAEIEKEMSHDSPVEDIWQEPIPSSSMEPTSFPTAVLPDWGHNFVKSIATEMQVLWKCQQCCTWRY